MVRQAAAGGTSTGSVYRLVEGQILDIVARDAPLGDSVERVACPRLRGVPAIVTRGSGDKQERN